jgi:hypothetical protein
VYFASAALALCVAVYCTFFSFVSGGGWPFLLPTLISVVCLSCGAGLSISRPLRGTWISGVGAMLCALAIIAALSQLIQAIPFHQQPQQALLLAAPGLFLLVMTFHVAAAVYKYKAAWNRQAEL